MSKVTVTRIIAEFLSGNLLEDPKGYAIPASADLYAQKCKEALMDVYPAAEITVSYREGRALQAHELMDTTVVFTDGSIQRYEDRGDAEIINAICEGVYNEQEWLVESGGESG